MSDDAQKSLIDSSVDQQKLRALVYKIISPAVTRMTRLVNDLYSPDSLGYQAPKGFRDSVQPPEFTSSYVEWYGWFHNVVAPVANWMRTLGDDADYTDYIKEKPDLLRDCLQCAIDHNVSAAGMLTKISAEEKMLLKKSFTEAIAVIDTYKKRAAMLPEQAPHP
jgi:hypothetical protein